MKHWTDPDFSSHQLAAHQSTFWMASCINKYQSSFSIADGAKRKITGDLANTEPFDDDTMIGFSLL